MVLRLRGYKKLKGGKQKLNDLSRNFHHLLTVSLRNLAAWQRLDNVEQRALRRRLKSTRDPKTSTSCWRMASGFQRLFSS